MGTSINSGSGWSKALSSATEFSDYCSVDMSHVQQSFHNVRNICFTPPYTSQVADGDDMASRLPLHKTKTRRFTFASGISHYYFLECELPFDQNTQKSRAKSRAPQKQGSDMGKSPVKLLIKVYL